MPEFDAKHSPQFLLLAATCVLLAACSRGEPEAPSSAVENARSETSAQGLEARTSKGDREASHSAGAAPIAVVELFTSEGCSSCPPADALLTELAALTPKHGTILTLSFHVDYWDYLGFKDPFSLAASSRRQRWYASHFEQRSTYTPQMVVGGRVGFVGSKRRRAKLAIKDALAELPSAEVRLTLDSDENSTTVSFSVAPRGGADLPPDTGVMLALAQVSATVPVSAGENRGTRLTHRNIVRAFTEQRTTTGKWILPAVQPLHTEGRHFKVVGVAQQRVGSRILGASSLQLPTAWAEAN